MDTESVDTIQPVVGSVETETREVDPQVTDTEDLAGAPSRLEAPEEPGPGSQQDFEEIPGESGERVPLVRVLESLLFAASEPLSLDDMQAVLKESGAIQKKYLRKALEALRQECAGRSFELVEVFGGYQFRTRMDFAPWIRKLLNIKRRERLSRSALETLAIIAYKQPVSRAEVESIRGVNVDGVMRVLLEKELIYQSGKKDIPGKPPLYSTTQQFLANFGLKTVQELPPLSDWSPN